MSGEETFWRLVVTTAISNAIVIGVINLIAWPFGWHFWWHQ